MRSGEARTNDALQSAGANASEYMPVVPAGRGWYHFGQEGGNYQERALTFVSPCVRGQAAQETFPQTGMRTIFDVRGCAGQTVLPQFYFPGWVANRDGSETVVGYDPKSGLLAVDVPPDSRSLTLHRTMLSVEKFGILVSITSLVILVTVLLIAMRGFQRGRPQDSRVSASAGNLETIR